MSVVHINSKPQFRFTGPRARHKVLAGLLFLADFVSTFWAPALMYCLVIYESRTFYPIVLIQAFGVPVGIYMYYKRSLAVSSQTIKSKPDVPKAATIYDFKKAA